LQNTITAISLGFRLSAHLFQIYSKGKTPKFSPEY